MGETENLKAGKESKAGVLSRAGHVPGHGEAVLSVVDAALYRETHRVAPKPSDEDEPDEEKGPAAE